MFLINSGLDRAIAMRPPSNQQSPSWPCWMSLGLTPWRIGSPSILSHAFVSAEVPLTLGLSAPDPLSGDVIGRVGASSSCARDAPPGFGDGARSGWDEAKEGLRCSA